MKWQRELLARQRQRCIDETNATVKAMSEAFGSVEPPTLDDLLSNAERDFTLRSSDRHSTPPPQTPRETSHVSRIPTKR